MNKLVSLEAVAHQDWTNRDRKGEFAWYSLAEMAQAIYKGKLVRVEQGEKQTVGRLVSVMDRGTNGIDVMVVTKAGQYVHGAIGSAKIDLRS